ncbi:outer membrane beta-barrel protein [Pedobacter sp.]|uniref:outer membrane beta-barrel protein n=1 Tax=Pedobacter sp. TaxID=1411316 RepID=UPI003D7FE217
MKRLLLSIVALVAFTFSTQAQTEKGNVLLGGKVGFGSSKTDGANKADVNYNLVPTVGYFVGDNFAVGTGVGYNYNKEVSHKNLNKAFEVSPFGRYYVDVADQFKFFGQLSVPMAFGSNTLVDNDGKKADSKYASTTSIGVNLAPGFAYYPTKKVGIEVSVNGLGYNNYAVKDEATGAKVKTNSFGLDANAFAPKLGVIFHF